MTKFVNFIGGNSPVSLPGQQPSQSRTLPTDKQVLTWNTALELWEPSTIVFALDDISDVNIPSPIDNQHIIWDSGTSKFIQSDTALFAAKVTGVDAAGNFTYYGKDAGGAIGFHAVPVIKTDFNSLIDVNIPTPVDGELVKWDSGTSMWIQVAQSAVNTTFDDTNVSFTAPDVQAALDTVRDIQPNHLINGDMSIWQRGTSQTTAGYASVDRYSLGLTGTATATITQITTDQVLPNDQIRNPVLQIAYVGSDLGANQVFLRQQIENGVHKLNQQDVTLSAMVFGDAGGEVIEMNLDDVHTEFTLVAGWQLITVTLPARDMTGDALYPQAFFDFRPIGTGTVKITDCKVEACSFATPFEQDSVADNLAKCQRYLEFVSTFSGYAASTAVMHGGANFAVEKRTTTYAVSSVGTILIVYGATLGTNVTCSLTSTGSQSVTGFVTVLTADSAVLTV
ncbi:MAG: hypothetical protein KAJ19_29015, partial [Gammaproteobacteria bacterium]|nr:hypothetical protein [Gammaproteobacteria bacterium]